MSGIRTNGPLRKLVARGVLVNAIFLAVVNGIGFLRGGIVVVLLSASQYGVWGIISSALALLIALRRNGVSDRYVQQEDEDQERAYQVALTLDIAYSVALLGLGLLLFPGMALAYGRDELLAPALAAALVLPGLALQTPLAIFYRRLDFKRQRTLQAIDPIVAFLVTVPLVALGAGYWGMIIGMLAGAWSAAAVALAICPYRSRWRWDRGALREYSSFTWPMMLAAVTAVAMAQTLFLTSESAVGLAGAGFVALSLTISQYANRFDQIVAGALYPALCTARERLDVLQESFVKASSLAVMWGFPLGLGLTVFAGPLVEHVLGPDWREGVIVLQATGIVVAVHRLGYAWDSIYRAIGRTRVIATNALIVLGGFFAIGLPLALAFGVEGVAAALLVIEAISLVSRAAIVAKLFPIGQIARDCLAPTLPTLVGVAVVLALRGTLHEDGSALRFAAELVTFAAVVLAATIRFERAVLTEMLGYLRDRSAPAAPITEPALTV